MFRASSFSFCTLRRRTFDSDRFADFNSIIGLVFSSTFAWNSRRNVPFFRFIDSAINQRTKRVNDDRIITKPDEQLLLWNVVLAFRNCRSKSENAERNRNELRITDGMAPVCEYADRSATIYTVIIQRFNISISDLLISPGLMCMRDISKNMTKERSIVILEKRSKGEKTKEDLFIFFF